mmetsp:Transcript_49676/g.144060  ORF Transcript_49676/g.144060 Transcript_49676/m.144060 type:complete len:202 (+) Transcript_49676:1001-1606(+)
MRLEVVSKRGPPSAIPEGPVLQPINVHSWRLLQTLPPDRALAPPLQANCLLEQGLSSTAPPRRLEDRQRVRQVIGRRALFELTPRVELLQALAVEPDLPHVPGGELRQPVEHRGAHGMAEHAVEPMDVARGPQDELQVPPRAVQQLRLLGVGGGPPAVERRSGDPPLEVVRVLPEPAFQDREAELGVPSPEGGRQPPSKCG